MQCIELMELTIVASRHIYKYTQNVGLSEKVWQLHAVAIVITGIRSSEAIQKIMTVQNVRAKSVRTLNCVKYGGYSTVIMADVTPAIQRFEKIFNFKSMRML